jgi:IS5 family transposase
MRQTSSADIEFASKKRFTRRERFLAEIEAATPWPALAEALLPHYPKGDGRGRPPTGLERMLRMYIAQQCLGLSDEGTLKAQSTTSNLFAISSASTSRTSRHRTRPHCSSSAACWKRTT